MVGFIIAIVSILIGGAIPLSAIFFSHKRSSISLQLKLAEQEINKGRMRSIKQDQEMRKIS